MNKRPNRSNVRAPTTTPATTITSSATLAVDGEMPVSASHGVATPEPLASHDVLQAALAPIEGDAPAGGAVNDVAVADQAPEKKPAKKSAKALDKAPAKAPAEETGAPVKAIKVPKIKFVKCTFALPESEAELLDAMKKTHQANGLALKKGQLLRAALLALADIDADRLAQLIAHLPVEPVAKKKKK